MSSKPTIEIGRHSEVKKVFAEGKLLLLGERGEVIVHFVRQGTDNFSELFNQEP